MTLHAVQTRLYVYVQTGCPACAEAEPHLAELRRRHPYDLFVVPLYLDRKEWKVGGWTPNATPGYALVVENKLVNKKVGTMTTAELEAWIGPKYLGGSTP